MHLFKISQLFLILSFLSILVVFPFLAPFSFIVGKYVFFRVTVLLALFFFFVGLLFYRDTEFETRAREVLSSPLSIALIVFIAVYLLAGFFGVHPSTSFWSTLTRGDGGFQMLVFLGFYFLLTTFFSSRMIWKKIFTYLVILGLFVLLYGVLAAFHLFGLSGPALSLLHQFHGTLGNPAFLGSYLLFLFFFALNLFFDPLSRFQKILGGASSVVFFVFLVITQTRGAFLGILVGLGVFLLFIFFSSRGLFRQRAGIILFAGIFICTALFTFRGTEFVQSLPGSRVFQISLTERTAQTRLWTWEAAFEGFLERPVLGWGTDQFSFVFNHHFNPRHFLPTEGSEIWFDRAHNVIFDYLVALGGLGLLSFLGVFFVFYHLLYRATLPLFTRAFLFAFPAAYFGQGMFLFDVFSTQLLLFTFLAFGVSTFLLPSHQSSS
ncbi:MAG: hypothetical protein A3F24_00935 [Candidatus Colwellbacteria bacterium RIFCSPHIGHO2_12_FULL_44_17]|uniref:O-antigen ligase-related domain-containing protein n=2 Tax=Candidatus Colwelliibacteriota TaxID=1817904 RepID=A0A1G1Z447_9BACT|nr:MAG: hypothetical protein A3I31_01230 [Candidatus Colwellbacteria bacterium RIFCSPLOWO2_02_FULL_44_20b]OGY60270.1 MAG: hypothetical protein A3F24_00935 [Candidatus Colwellbacteria bacterium RIFCSPHIGHO2_12_FULL_44_17]